MEASKGKTPETLFLLDGTSDERLSARAYVEAAEGLAEMRGVERPPRLEAGEPLEPVGPF